MVKKNNKENQEKRVRQTKSSIAENYKIKLLNNLLYPKNIAVIGASNKKSSVGNEIILRLKSFGFKGKIFPINLKEKSIENIPCYDSVLKVKEKIDLAIIAIPADKVLDIIDECAKAKIKSIVVISSGFKEVGEQGQQLEKKLLNKIKQNNMILVGPNCLGVINSCDKIKMNASFAPLNPLSGNIGFASQSGALGSGFINILPQINLGLGQFVSLGNGADITAVDLIEFWENDKNIDLIILYLESISDLQKFKTVCSRVSLKKPIIVIKSGRSSVGAKATASHTGSLAGDDVTISAVLNSCGVIRELNLRDFVSTARIFATTNIPKGEKLAILTNAGGPGILASDCAEDENLQLASLTSTTKEKLRLILSQQASINNPLDVVASASLEQIVNSADILLKSDEVDILFVIYLYITGQNDVPLTIELEKLKLKYPNKTIVGMYMTTNDFTQRLQETKKTNTLITENKNYIKKEIPIFNFVVDAIHGIKRLVERKRYLDEQKEDFDKYKFKLSVEQKNQIKNILDNAKNKNVKTLSTFDSLNIFSLLNLPVVKYEFVKNLHEAKKVAKKITYPVTIKISSDLISHKTDVGGVVTNIKNEKELIQEWNFLLKHLQKIDLLSKINGFIIMKNIQNAKREFVAGIATKPNIGKVAMFGIGGIFIETLKEVAFSPCPLNHIEVRHLINNSKASLLLGNVRDNKEVNKSYLEDILLKFSYLCETFKNIQELDANPIMVDKNGDIFIVDARIVITD